MEFNNQQIDTELLPRIEDLQYSGLQSDYKKLLVIIISIVNVILITLFLCYVKFDPLNLPNAIIYGIAALITLRVIWSFISALKKFEYMSFALREKDIIYNKGWLWRQTIIVPFNRVQHIQVDQGPLERKFNLASLKIFTAGGTSSDISIPGLRPEKARQLKEFIVSKTAMDEEE